MTNGDPNRPLYDKPQICLVNCAMWPHCRCGERGYIGEGVYTPPVPNYTPKGCICPPTSEKTCQRWDCGRKSVGSGGVGL